MKTFWQWLEDMNGAGISGADYSVPAIIGGGGAGPAGMGEPNSFNSREKVADKRKRRRVPLGDFSGYPNPIKIPIQNTITNRLP